MTHSLHRSAAALPGALLIAALLVTAGAHAQQVGGAPGTTNGMLTGPVVGAASGVGRRTAPPPAIPGARTTDSEPAPMDRLATDMRPNDALFDSVNRGDIAGAREAIGRGADLNATNVLGLTPVELAVDLGRNDITFLLLSMRGASPGVVAPGAASAKAATPARTAARTETQRPAARPIPVATRAASPPPPRQYADTPGTPVPQSGFLGFAGVTR